MEKKSGARSVLDFPHGMHILSSYKAKAQESRELAWVLARRGSVQAVILLALARC